VNLDFDWIYRKLGRDLGRGAASLVSGWLADAQDGLRSCAVRSIAFVRRHHGPESLLAGTWPTGAMALWVMVLLLAYLIFYYV